MLPWPAITFGRRNRVHFHAVPTAFLMIQFSDMQLSKAPESAPEPVNKSTVRGSHRPEIPAGHSQRPTHPEGTPKSANAACVTPEIPEDISNAIPSEPQNWGISRTVVATQQSCRLVDKTQQHEASVHHQHTVCRMLKFTDSVSARHQNRKIRITFTPAPSEGCVMTILTPPLEQSGDPVQIPYTSRLLESSQSL